MMAQMPAPTIDPSLADGPLTEQRRQKPHRVPARVRQLEGTTRRVAQPLVLPEREWRAALQSALDTTSLARNYMAALALVAVTTEWAN